MSETRRIEFGKPWQTIDPVEYRDGFAAGLIDCFIDETGSVVKRDGLTLFSTLAGNKCVPSIYETISGVCIGVSNGTFNTIASNGTPTPWTGNGTTVDAHVTYAEDGSFIYAAHGGNLTQMNATARTGAFIAGSTIPANATHIVYKDGYMMTNGLINGGIAGDENYSDDKANNYTTWDVFNNEMASDDTNGVFTRIGDPYVHGTGTNSIEASLDDGVTPWALAPGTAPAIGLRSPLSMVDVGGTWYFLGIVDGAPRIVTLDRSQFTVVSTPYDQLIRYYTSDNTRAWAMTMRSKPFYVISFPTDGMTFYYNIQDKHWGRFGYWQSGGGGGYSHTQYLIYSSCFVKSFPKQLVGSRSTTGKIYEITGLTDEGAAICMQATTGKISWGNDLTKRSERLRFKIKRGQTASASVEPTFNLYIRDDGAASWGTAITVGMGLKDDVYCYSELVGLGMYRERQYMIEHLDTATDFILVNMEETYTQLNW